jgi:hypothetical protein
MYCKFTRWLIFLWSCFLSKHFKHNKHNKLVSISKFLFKIKLESHKDGIYSCMKKYFVKMLMLSNDPLSQTFSTCVYGLTSKLCPYSWDLNRVGYLTLFNDTIPNDIFHLVNFAKILLLSNGSLSRTFLTCVFLWYLL